MRRGSINLTFKLQYRDKDAINTFFFFTFQNRVYICIASHVVRKNETMMLNRNMKNIKLLHINLSISINKIPQTIFITSILSFYEEKISELCQNRTFEKAVTIYTINKSLKISLKIGQYHTSTIQ